jgi:hypothetical protein
MGKIKATFANFAFKKCYLTASTTFENSLARHLALVAEENVSISIYNGSVLVGRKLIIYFCNFSIESGFRNSGLTVGKAGKVVLAVRSSHGLEVPLSHPESGRLLVDKTYVDFLTALSNDKLSENSGRIRDRFFGKTISAEKFSDNLQKD